MESEKEILVSCTWCEKIFPESDIITSRYTGEQFCPFCKENDCLVDLDEEDTEEYYKNLKREGN